MDKRTLLNRVRPLWPDVITLRPDGGEAALNNIYWPIEAKLDNDGDEWAALSAWAFHQALWDHARHQSGVGSLLIRPANVSLEAFHFWMRKNLSDESWAHFREEYDGLPSADR